ncbi:MAG TPA: phage holin family protein [Jatrophihabitantaceae bacterium]
MSTTQLVSRLTEELSRLARAEFQLARMRLQRNGKRAGLGAGTMGGAGAMAAYGCRCLVAAAIVALAMAMQAWAAALVVGVALIVGAALAGVVHEASAVAGGTGRGSPPASSARWWQLWRCSCAAGGPGRPPFQPPPQRVAP